ncbi:B-cell lymphoma 3 protein [Tritrichomonas musculus]|uniref:B-cell lymphoma 3 protein n=1 Tax=Tritrichomonas musculus TaxID=1915356 RepID=A0ABR2HVK3_9EUKA
MNRNLFFIFYRTPLHYAAKKNQALATRLLLDDGADPCIFDKNGFTPLHSACEYGSNDVINTLFENKMDPNTSFRKGVYFIFLTLGTNSHSRSMSTY